MTKFGEETSMGESGLHTGEETLRLIAGLPAPSGLEDRIRTNLRNAPHMGRVLDWPAAQRPMSPWMRGAAAAAIACVVAGGCWGIYTRVQPAQEGGAIAQPRGSAGGFSSAGAVRSPNTLNGPSVQQPPTAPHSAVHLKTPKGPSAEKQKTRHSQGGTDASAPSRTPQIK